MLDDLALLRTEVELLFGRSADGRLELSHHLVLAVATDGAAALVPGPAVPVDLTGELRDVLDSAGWEAAVELARRRLADVGPPPVVSSGPSYLVPAGLQSESAVAVTASDTSTGSELLGANPGNWPDHEWAQLLAGEHGPWAMIVRNGLEVALAHVPVFSSAAAEVGVWTHPDHRGRGYAPAVTAALAALVSPGRRLFYSTSADNLASQRVAARLRLRPIGWLWRLSPPGTAHLHRGWGGGTATRTARW